MFKKLKRRFSTGGGKKERKKEEEDREEDKVDKHDTDDISDVEESRETELPRREDKRKVKKGETKSSKTKDKSHRKASEEGGESEEEPKSKDKGVEAREKKATSAKRNQRQTKIKQSSDESNSELEEDEEEIGIERPSKENNHSSVEKKKKLKVRKASQREEEGGEIDEKRVQNLETDEPRSGDHVQHKEREQKRKDRRSSDSKREASSERRKKRQEELVEERKPTQISSEEVEDEAGSCPRNDASSSSSQKRRSNRPRDELKASKVPLSSALDGENIVEPPAEYEKGVVDSCGDLKQRSRRKNKSSSRSSPSKASSRTEINEQLDEGREGDAQSPSSAKRTDETALHEPTAPIPTSRSSVTLERTSITASDEEDAGKTETATESETVAYPLLQSFVESLDSLITAQMDARTSKLLSAEKWSDRELALQSVVKHAKDWAESNAASGHTLLQYFTVALAVFQRGLEDKIAPVAFSALENFDALVDSFNKAMRKTKTSPGAGRATKKTQQQQQQQGATASDPVLEEQVASIFGILLKKSCESTKRMRREACKTVFKLLQLEQVDTLKPLLVELESDRNPLRSRLFVLKLLIEDIGFVANKGFSAERAMRILLPALQVADRKTRKTAVAAGAAACAIGGEQVEEYLRDVKTSTAKLLKDEIRKREEKKKNADDTSPSNSAGTGADVTKAKANLLPGAKKDDRASDDSEGEDNHGRHTRAALNQALEEEEELLQSEASALVGPVLLHSLGAEKWSDRRDACEAITKLVDERRAQLKRVHEDERASVAAKEFGVHCAICRKCLSDSVAPVYYAAFELLRTIMKVYTDHVSWKDSTIQGQITTIVLAILPRLNDTNQRTQKEACRALLKIARLQDGSGITFIYPFLMENSGPALKMQLNMLRLLIPECGFSKEGIIFKKTMKTARQGLEATDEKTRKLAVSVVAATQKLAGTKRVMRYLEGLKPSLMQTIEKKFQENGAQEEPVDSKDKQQASRAAAPRQLEPLDNPLRSRTQKSGLQVAAAKDSLRNGVSDTPQHDVKPKSRESQLSSRRPSRTEKIKSREDGAIKADPLVTNKTSMSTSKPLEGLSRPSVAKKAMNRQRSKPSNNNDDGDDVRDAAPEFGDAFDQDEAELMAAIAGL